MRLHGGRVDEDQTMPGSIWRTGWVDGSGPETGAASLVRLRLLRMWTCGRGVLVLRSLLLIALGDDLRSLHRIVSSVFALFGRPLVRLRGAVSAAVSVDHRMPFLKVLLEQRGRAPIVSADKKMPGSRRNRACAGAMDQSVGSTRRFSSRCSPPRVAAQAAAAAPTSKAAAVRKAVRTAILRARSAACLAVSLACESRA